MMWLRKIWNKKMVPAMTALFGVLLIGTNCLDAYAAEVSELDLDRRGSVQITLYSEETDSFLKDGALTIYQVATLYLDDGNMAYALTEDFEKFSGNLDVMYASLASDLADYVSEHSEPDLTENPDGQTITGTEQTVGEDGTVVFEDLEAGLYLIIQTELSVGYYAIDPFVVTVPFDVNGEWVYDVDASPKTEIEPVPETDPPKETESEPQSESETESEPVTETEPQSEPESEPQSETEPQTESESEPQSESESELQSETEPGSEVESESEIESEHESESESESETESEIESESETDPGTESETESEIQTESEPQTETKQTASSTESETESEKLPQTGQLNWPIPLLAVGGVILLALGVYLARPKGKGQE